MNRTRQADALEAMKRAAMVAARKAREAWLHEKNDWRAVDSPPGETARATARHALAQLRRKPA